MTNRTASNATIAELMEVLTDPTADCQIVIVGSPVDGDPEAWDAVVSGRKVPHGCQSGIVLSLIAAMKPDGAPTCDCESCKRLGFARMILDGSGVPRLTMPDDGTKH